MDIFEFWEDYGKFFKKLLFIPLAILATELMILGFFIILAKII